MEEGEAIGARNRQRKLYINTGMVSYYNGERSSWDYDEFGHPATFDTLAMDPNKKEIMDDLVTFSKAKEYYQRIGKAWK